MYFPYGLWKDAGREARRMPPSNGGGGATLFVLFIGGLVVFSCFSAGEYGILLGIAFLFGILNSLNK